MPVTPGVVVFVPADFKTAFPEFVSVVDAALTINFAFATLLLNNSCSSRVTDPNVREALLNLLTAHITELRNGKNGLPPQGIVGRVSDATEGSVSVSADMGTVVYGQAYYIQTEFGAMFWAMTARYRTARFIPAPLVCADFAGIGPLNPGGFPGAGFGGGCGC